MGSQNKQNIILCANYTLSDDETEKKEGEAQSENLTGASGMDKEEHDIESKFEVSVDEQASSARVLTTKTCF